MKTGILVCASMLGLVTPVVAQPPPSPEAAVSSKLAYLIKSPSGSLDNLFEVVSTKAGFLVSFARSAGSVPPFTLYTQRFSSTGRPIGSPVKIDGPGIVGDHMEMAKTGATTAVAAWMAGGQVKVGKLSLTTGKVSSAKSIGKTDDHIHDIAVLSNGNVAVVTPQITPLPLPGKYKIMLKVLSPSFGTVKDWTVVNGTGFSLDPWAYIDQTVVARKTGGTVLYRDRTTQKIKGRNFSNTGGLGSSVTLSTTPFASFFVQDIAFLEVKAVTLTNGSVAACWTVSRAAAARYTVRCRLLTAAGKPTGREIVPTTAAGSQMSPEVIALPNGRFTVTWAQQDGAFPSAVKYRTYDSKGKPVTPERIGVALTGVHIAPLSTEGALLADGSIVNLVSPEFTTPGIMGFGIAKPGK